jgi:hypothetical protein
MIMAVITTIPSFFQLHGNGISAEFATQFLFLFLK